jgi:RNase H-fold protein (predicted Holliday junction resolvase)
MKPQHVTRIMALDIRRRRVGYAIFEAPLRFLDWGVLGSRYCPPETGRIRSLSQLLHPSVVVLGRIPQKGRRNNSQTKTLFRAVQAEIRRSSVPIVYIGERLVRNFFHRYGAHGKQAVAVLLAKAFPELAGKLPPPRKVWQAEARRMSIFDAAALALTYFTLESDSGAVREMITAGSFRRPLSGVAKLRATAYLERPAKGAHQSP